MPRLIDADALEKKLHELALDEWNQKASTTWSNALLECEDMVYNAPTVDAIPVVRCKDCKHNYHNMIPSGEAEYGCTKCIELPITADFYCSWAERREDESE